MSDLATGGIAPDSRLTTIATPKGAYMGEMGWMVPFFCASCHRHCGDCPAENMTFICYLCNQCEPKYGPILGTMSVPDQVWWRAIKEESLEKFGRELTREELDVIVAADSSPLATLIKEGSRGTLTGG